MFILCNTLLPNVRVHTISADIRTKIKILPVIDIVINVDVAPIKTLVSTDSNVVFTVLYIFSYLVYGFYF